MKAQDNDDKSLNIARSSNSHNNVYHLSHSIQKYLKNLKIGDNIGQTLRKSRYQIFWSCLIFHDNLNFFEKSDTKLQANQYDNLNTFSKLRL